MFAFIPAKKCKEVVIKKVRLVRERERERNWKYNVRE
jgi:hypothetical protein